MPDPHEGKTGYEHSDVSVPGVALFIIALGVFLAVFLVFCFGMGKVINTAIIKHDGPLNKWNAIPGQPRKGLQNLQSDAAAQQEELRRLTAKFPTPRVQLDNGDEDTANLHAREDLLLDHYSWVDQKQGKVRIPIARAMELIAGRGLPIAPNAPTEPLMTADKAPEIPVPLTNGFARTGYEQQELQTVEQQRERGETPPEQAALRKAR